MRHLSLPKQNITPIVDQLDFVLCHANRGKILGFFVILLEAWQLYDNHWYGMLCVSDPISFSKNLFKAYDDLSKHLRLLDDIPLRISSVQSIDSGLFLKRIASPSISLATLTITCLPYLWSPLRDKNYVFLYLKLKFINKCKNWKKSIEISC